MWTGERALQDHCPSTHDLMSAQENYVAIVEVGRRGLQLFVTTAG